MTPPANPFLALKARTLLLWFLLLSLSLVIGLVLLLVVGRLRLDDLPWLGFHYLLTFGCLCGLCWRRLRQAGANPVDVVGRRSLGYPIWVVVGLVTALLLCSLGASSVVSVLLLSAKPDYIQSVIAELFKPRSISTVVFSVVDAIVLLIAAPVFEEFLCRGVLLQRWATKWNVRTALIVSSLVFGLLHFNHNVLWLSLFGLVMGLLYLKTRSLFTSIVCHGLNNAMVMGLSFLSSGNPKAMATALESARSWWGLDALLIPVSVLFLLRFIFKNFPHPNAQIPYFINAGAKNRASHPALD